MRTFLIHRPLYRILSPLINGLVAYLLVLLVNNNVEQLAEQFLGQELYLMIILAALVQEFTRLLLRLTTRYVPQKNYWLKPFSQTLATVLLTLLLVNGFMILYYQQVLEFSPTRGELIIFSGIFLLLNGVYLSLYLGHQSLQRANERQLQQELTLQKETERNFREFKKGLNPGLLFHSLETLIVLTREKPESAEQLLEQLSTVYRYTLSGKKKQLASLEEDLKHLAQFIKLLNLLPLRAIEFKAQKPLSAEKLVVPGSLLTLTELIARTSILSAKAPLKLELKESDNFWLLQYRPFEKIGAQLKKPQLRELQETYSFYSERELEVQEENGNKTIKLPKLSEQ